MEFSKVRISELDNQAALQNFTCMPARVNEQIHNVAKDYQRIDEFLQRRALTMEQNHLFRTTLILDEQCNIIAFYSLCAGTRTVFKKFRRETHIPHKAKNMAIPTVELIWFAVADEYQGRGVGKRILSVILKEVLAVTRQVGAGLFVVESLADACGFYEQRGFKDIGEPHKLDGDVIMAITVTDLEGMFVNK
ncbi:GNAT family N-acetyltransferase [Lacticaseibacillus sharpeae]|uniref:N-acetyltransferase domain-containing protein n=1 Tax=Lacticaseibacillus sharpeae JCM 1186 = DSM 20505 TaxID=1291052 RepID=A0A0R1ZMR9_9LACO|nr:GNAT family N-acetyltransferase [Lacticaseibacillus sharpeae]KRM54404.1 hypothetical protein FC18_GL000626 [Lacticaseibacillus sharpeae JCM 1186 = DSM 20505]